MTMDRDLFLAILSMDSYNRDYGAGILLAGTDIGNASVVTRQSLGLSDTDYQIWQAAGFYAIAYDVSQAGIEGLTGTVISYRGTDSIGSDMLYGWTLGGGLASASQGRLAIEFYNAVIRAAGDDPAASVFDIGTSQPILTGHSLGGGNYGDSAYKYRCF